MDVRVNAGDPVLAPGTRRLLDRMLCAFSGLAESIGFIVGDRDDPRIAVAGGEMTGVHVLRGLPPPPPGAYHIGGSGITYDEAVIRTLGETVERYTQYVALAGNRHELVHDSADSMSLREGRLLVPPQLRWFRDEQLARPGFPFQELRRDAVIGWIGAPSLHDGEPCWVPAQEALPGYIGRRGEEPRVMSGVTTGSAAHTRPELALRNALLELIQIDAAIGHWHGRPVAVPIQGGRRLHSVERAIARRLPASAPRPRLFWLPSADLPGFPVACLVEAATEPFVGVGLGCDLRLGVAAYKAFLEAVAVAQLAKVILFRESVNGSANGATGDIYDLDANVGLYASGKHEVLEERFGRGPASSSDELPPDVERGAVGDVVHLVEGFRATGKELVLLDLTTPDVRELGFRALRVWSPDTLVLPLPSAPPLAHPRFDAYGGVANEAPHPYP
jgi:thiazole/oxazole-forming peptide maturase SagD family component